MTALENVCYYINFKQLGLYLNFYALLMKNVLLEQKKMKNYEINGILWDIKQ